MPWAKIFACMFFRVTRAGPYEYLQIARSHRDGKTVRQQTLLSLGRLDILRASGQLDALLRSGLRLCERLTVVDAHAAGQSEPVAVRRIGADLVFSRLWEQTGIQRCICDQLEGRRYEFSVERAIYLTVLHRLFASGSDRAAERWREQYRIAGADQLELHHLYRAMAFLGDPLEEKATVLGSPRCIKDRIEEALFDRRRDLFTEVDLVFFDTTSIYFEGGGGESLGQYGHSKDHRADLKQMILGLVLDIQGWPLCCEMWPGNTTDVKTLVPVVERLKQRFRVREMCVLADRGMISDETIAALEGSDPPVHYILGARMRRQKEVSEKVLTKRGPWQELYPERTQSKDPAPLKVREVRVGDHRYVVCLNEEERRHDAQARQAIVQHLREQLKRGDKSLVGNKGYRRFLKVQGGDHFVVDEESVKHDARFDGLWVLRTNTELENESVAIAYKHLWMVEDLFRTTKSILQTRPIYHKCDETIRGHVFCSFLALLLKADLEQRLREREESWEWAEIVRGLENLQEVEAVFQGRRFFLRSQLVAQAHKAIRASGVAVPPTIREG
jgi:transposase